MSYLLTAQSDDAHAAANRNRALQADWILDVAVKDSIRWTREGAAPELVALRLARAGNAAERILGGGTR